MRQEVKKKHMTGKTHMAVGVGAGVAFAYCGIKTYGDSMYVFSIIASAVGAMLPDIDHNNSKLGSRRKMVVDAVTKTLTAIFGLVVLVFCGILTVSKLYTELILLLLFIILPVYVYALSLLIHLPFIRKRLKFLAKHRGIMHTLAAPLLLYFGYMFISSIIVRFGLLAMVTGYISHLALDCMTKRGCPILWPVTSKNISLLHRKRRSTNRK